MTALEINYRHTPDGRPHYIKSNDIEQVALGDDGFVERKDRAALTLGPVTICLQPLPQVIRPRINDAARLALVKFRLGNVLSQPVPDRVSR